MIPNLGHLERLTKLREQSSFWVKIYPYSRFGEFAVSIHIYILGVVFYYNALA